MTVITEFELDSFRAEKLSPAALLRMVVDHVHVLIRVAVGVGKSWAVDQLLVWLPLYARFGLVIYLAPTRAVLREREARLKEAGFPFGMRVLEPRPRSRCGPLNARWLAFEAMACTALAKKTLCEKECPHRLSCEWPKQFKNLKGVHLVLATEQNAVINRSLVLFLQRRTDEPRVLVILDEARLLDANFELRVSRDEVQRFAEALAQAHSRKRSLDAAKATWLEEIPRLLAASEDGFQRGNYRFGISLHSHAYAIQQAGWKLYGDKFRYAGYDLTQLAWSRQNERQVADGRFVFVARPYLNKHVLMLSASLTGKYVGHRLGGDPVASPLEETRFVHTSSRVLNVRDRCGADRNFSSNKGRILDTFALIIARNINEGRSTLVISRKKTKEMCADYLQGRLRRWGFDVQFLTNDAPDLPGRPDPLIIPALHYGLLGINTYEEYESALCLNSFYVKDADLNARLQEYESRHFQANLEIYPGADGLRRVREAKDPNATRERLYLGEIYHRKMEVDPAVQAVGRCRFQTRPRLVVFFQCNDLGLDIPDCEDVRSLVELRRALNLPEPRIVDSLIQGLEAQRLMAEGLTAEQAATRMGVGRRTLFRRLEGVESAKRHSGNCLHAKWHSPEAGRDVP